jgi:hypothetical protein
MAGCFFDELLYRVVARGIEERGGSSAAVISNTS